MKLPAIYVVTLMLAALSFTTSDEARAACTCICVDGLNRPLCSGVNDRIPVCPPKVCPTEPPITRPLDQPRLPPAGTAFCTDEYIYNRYSQRYEWRQFCR